MPTLVRHLISLITFAALIGGALAQDDEPTVRFKFAIHVWQEAQTGDDKLTHHDGLFYQQGKDWKELKMREGQRIDDLEYRGGKVFTLARRELVDEEIVYRPVATATVNASWKQALFYLFPRENGKYQLQAINLSKLHRKKGTMVFANFSPDPLRVGIHGKNPQLLESGKTLELSLKGLTKHRLPLQAWAKPGEEWLRIYSRVTAISAESFYFAYTYKVPGTQQYRVFIERGLEYSKFEEELEP